MAAKQGLELGQTVVLLDVGGSTEVGGDGDGRDRARTPPCLGTCGGTDEVKVLCGEEKEGTKFGDLGEGWDEGSIRRETTN